jgi:large subunit ribosomal protein L14e
MMESKRGHGRVQETPLELGSIVQTRAGRDKGRYFVVVNIIDDDYVHIVDGALRKLANPKRKKRKHLDITGEVHEGLRVKIMQGTRIFDSEVRSCLKNMGYMPHVQRGSKEG